MVPENKLLSALTARGKSLGQIVEMRAYRDPVFANIVIELTDAHSGNSLAVELDRTEYGQFIADTQHIIFGT